jgi:hypothetical protein
MKKTKREKTPAALPIRKNKKPVAGRTAQKTSKGAPVKERRAKEKSDATKKSGYPIKEGSVLKKVAPFREIPSEDPPPVPPVEGEPPRYLPIRNMTPAQWRAPFEILTAYRIIDWVPCRELIEGIYGKKAGWMELVIFLAKQEDRKRGEILLGKWLFRCAVEEKAEDLAEFTKAVRRVSRSAKDGAKHEKFVAALMFYLRFEARTGLQPTQPQVRRFLDENEYFVLPDETLYSLDAEREDPRKNEKRDLFRGPVLGNLQKGKPGPKPNSPS